MFLTISIRTDHFVWRERSTYRPIKQAQICMSLSKRNKLPTTSTLTTVYKINNCALVNRRLEVFSLQLQFNTDWTPEARPNLWYLDRVAVPLTIGSKLMNPRSLESPWSTKSLVCFNFICFASCRVPVPRLSVLVLLSRAFQFKSGEQKCTERTRMV